MLNSTTGPSRYWATVFKVEAGLPPDEIIWITSVNYPMEGDDWRSGVTCGVIRRNAAIRIAEGTHRVATPAEVEAEHARSQASSELCKQQEKLNKGQQDVTIGADLLREVLGVTR